MRHAIFTVFLLIGLTTVLAAEVRSQTIDAGTWAGFLKARALFAQHCEPCHGLEEDASPFAPTFALGEGLEAEFGLLLLTIQEGLGYMPSWQGVLSYEEQEWVLIYAHVLPGDNVFRKQCETCHAESVPRVPARIPRGAALDAYDGPIHANSGTEVARTWNREEQANVIRMLRWLDEER